jgi:hypothetical protein
VEPILSCSHLSQASVPAFQEVPRHLGRGSTTPQLELSKATGKQCKAMTKDGTAWAMPGGLCNFHVKGGGTAGGLPESAAGTKRVREELTAATWRVGGTQLRALLRDRRPEALPPTRTGQHFEAAVGSCRRVQPQPDPAPAAGCSRAFRTTPLCRSDAERGMIGGGVGAVCHQGASRRFGATGAGWISGEVCASVAKANPS